MKKITLILFALFTCWQINAQVSSYGFSQNNGTYSEITGGTVLGVATNDDDNFNANPIGFSFVFNGITYTQFSVNANGFIALGATITSSYTAISSGATNNIISALNGDLNGSATGELSYQLSGTAPNQVLTVQWKNYRHYNATGDANNFQIKLYETTNVVDVVYGTFTQNATSRTRQVGLRGASNADFNNRSTTTDWSATTAGATNNASCTLTTAVVPISGLTFTWTPPSCAAPGGFVVSSLTSTSATISWNAAIPVPSTGYEYYYSDVNTAPAGAGTATTALTEDLAGLTPNTTYYVWLRSDCGGGTFSAWAGPFTFFTGYCTPSSTASTSYVDNFTTSGGSLNISNLTSGFTAGGYLNATSQVVESYETGSLILMLL
uniref:fibronectin type III domain-containing protein n=1 Tax=Flavobacterium sp. TaxID=239 RepID=UPI004047AD58